MHNYLFKFKIYVILQNYTLIIMYKNVCKIMWDLSVNMWDLCVIIWDLCVIMWDFTGLCGFMRFRCVRFYGLCGFMRFGCVRFHKTCVILWDLGVWDFHRFVSDFMRFWSEISSACVWFQESLTTQVEWCLSMRL